MGGRGGSSGLSGGSSLPKLEGSEKQVKWAEDIRNRYNFTEQQMKRAVESTDINGVNPAIRGTMESIVLKKHKEFENSVQMQNQFKSEQYSRQYVKSHNIEMTEDFKRKRSEDTQKAKEKYKQWLIKEYKKILKTEKSAKWWIDNR